MTVNRWLEAAKNNERIFFIEDTTIRSFPARCAKLCMDRNAKLYFDLGNTNIALSAMYLDEQEAARQVMSALKQTYNI